jgi:hypothetical protein
MHHQMFRKILLYGLPIYLYGLELLLKASAKVTIESFAGPTLAGAGIGFLLPLTELKPVPIDANLIKQLQDVGAKVYSPRDKTLCDLVWVAFFLSLGGWMYSIYLTMQPLVTNSTSKLVNWPFTIGCIIFLVSILLAEVKERI